MEGSELINPSPVVHERRERTTRRASRQAAPGPLQQPHSSQREPIDAQEVFEHVRDVTDPEHPYTLEQLNVVSEDLIDVDDAGSCVRCAGCTGARARTHARHGLSCGCMGRCVQTRAPHYTTKLHACLRVPDRMTFTPTVPHCSMSTLIGLCLRVKLLRALPGRFKLDIKVRR